MAKAIILTGILILAFFSNSQNNRIQLDELSQVYDSLGYSKTKSYFLKAARDYEINPYRIRDFMQKSLAEKDINMFKKCARVLSKKYGYYFSTQDTVNLIVQPSNSFANLVVDNKLMNWLVKTTTRRYGKWASKHIAEIQVNEGIAELFAIDQEFREDSFDEISDSTRGAILSKLDYIHLTELLQLCKQNNNFMPNPYDNGIMVKDWSLVIWHNLKDSTKTKLTWQLIFPYFEKSYVEGKLGTGTFYAYDYWLAEFFGYQYWGTLKNIPLDQSEQAQALRLKYNL